MTTGDPVICGCGCGLPARQWPMRQYSPRPQPTPAPPSGCKPVIPADRDELEMLVRRVAYLEVRVAQLENENEKQY